MGGAFEGVSQTADQRSPAKCRQSWGEPDGSNIGAVSRINASIKPSSSEVSRTLGRLTSRSHTLRLAPEKTPRNHVTTSSGILGQGFILSSGLPLGHIYAHCSETSSSQNAAIPFGKLPGAAYLPRQRQMGGTYWIALVQAVHLVCESGPTPRHAPHNCLGDRRDIGLGHPTAFSGLPPAFSGLPPAFLSVCHC